MGKGVSKTEVYDFKENWCDENKTIAELIKNKTQDYLIPPILDVGSGLGDIAYYAFPEKEAVCIDVNSVTEQDYPLSPRHKREQVDFFFYQPQKPINTILISHTLQFIDEDMEKLNSKITSLAPRYIVLVINDNDDFMGELIKWTNNNCKISNPEVHHIGFPQGYVLHDRISFSSTVSCPNFTLLAKQVSYLMLIDIADKEDSLKQFLVTKLNNQPNFTFKQSIEIYAKSKR